MSRAKEQACDCLCGRTAFHSQLKEVAIEQAIDPSLRQTATAQRFWVHPLCEKDFLDELGGMVLINQLVRAWTPPTRTRYWLIRFWFIPSHPWSDLYRWWRRIGASVKVLRLQHAIYERPYKIRYGEIEGFARVRRKAMQSAILFGCPRFMQGFLYNRLMLRAKRKALRDAARTPVIVTKAEA